MLDSPITQTLEEHGLEENSGSYDDYRDAINILRVNEQGGCQGRCQGCKERTKQFIKQYINIP